MSRKSAAQTGLQGAVGDASSLRDTMPAIVSVAFPYAPVGARAVGGAEVICTQVDEAVRSFGFEAVLIAQAGSTAAGKLYETSVPASIITDEVRIQVEAEHQANLERALKEHAVVLVHMHGMDFYRYRVPAEVPVLVTLHLPPSWYPESIWTMPEHYQFICVSESQRQACPSAVRDRLLVVENGVPLPPVSSLQAHGRYAVLLSRICPEKNLHVGLDAARRAGMHAILGGEVFPYEEHQMYFEREIAPRLSSRGGDHQGRGSLRRREATARFVGPVAQTEKARLLGRAACLLLPSLAPETSSLVAMEAMAAGVPVVAMRVGAVPEIVEHGRTGFLVEPGDDAALRMAECITRVPELNRETCRLVAAERFQVETMLARYAQLYRRLARHLDMSTPGRALETSAVEALGSQRPEPLESCEVDVHKVESEAQLAALVPEWEALWGMDAAATPFQHPAWLIPWWEQFGPDGRLAGCAVRDRQGQELLGFLPTYVYADAVGGRQLLLMGAGTTDYLEGVWAPEGAVPAEAALQYVLERRDLWDVCSLHQLRANSLLLEAGRRAHLVEDVSEPTSLVDLQHELPAKIRANVNRYRRQAEKLGPVALEIARDEQEALALFEELVSLHSQRWRERGEQGVLVDGRVLAHHRRAIPQLQRAGLLRMFSLRIAGDRAGVLYGLADPEQRQKRRMYLYLIGFSQSTAELSPGTLLSTLR